MNILSGVVASIEADFKSQDDAYNNYLELGVSYFLGKEYDKSISIFEKAIELDSKNSGGWIGKALSHLADSDIVSINEINIRPYLQSAEKHSDPTHLEKYLIAVALHYAYNYAAAIKLYIDQVNQAIQEKKKAQITAAIGIATALAGGAIARESKSLIGTVAGYGMLSGGVGLTVKGGLDSFRLEELSKSLYGNALAQTVISVPVIMQCYSIYHKSSGDLKYNTAVILDSWKESVVYLFANEKRDLLEKMKDLSNSDNMLDKDKMGSITKKVDEILYFMDLLGFDNTEEMTMVRQLKSKLNRFHADFGADRIEEIKKRKNKANMGCVLYIIFIFLIFGIFSERVIISPEIDEMLGIVLFASGAWRVYKWYKGDKSIDKESGLAEPQEEMNKIVEGIGKLEVSVDKVDLKMLGV